MKRTYIRRAAELVTCSGNKAKHGSDMKEVGIIKNGAVLIEDGRIARVGTTEELDKEVDFSTAELIDADGQAVLPGFVDSTPTLSSAATAPMNSAGAYREKAISRLWKRAAASTQP